MPRLRQPVQAGDAGNRRKRQLDGSALHTVSALELCGLLNMNGSHEMRTTARRWFEAGMARIAVIAWITALIPGCGPRDLPPFGQARVRVLTDAPVPGVVSRVRIDVYTEDGSWIESRDSSVREPSAWPASFTVFSVDSAAPRRARLRVRAYREGALRDYRGERYVAPPPPDASPAASPPEPPTTYTPRLLRDGHDLTPSSEPLPESAIDRLAWVTLEEGDVRDVQLVLRIACAGTMADLARDRTCIDIRGATMATPEAGREQRSVSDWEVRLAQDTATLPKPRARGTARDGTPLLDEEVLVPGGAMVLGSRAELTRTDGRGTTVTSDPERIFVVPPLLVDRYEVTVARYRDALRRGFVPPDEPLINDFPGFVETPTREGFCTYSTKPFSGAASRETMPMTCVTHATARAFCAFDGGDLLTETQWEYIATSSGRPAKTAFPWGDAAPSCSEAVYGRAVVPTTFLAVTPCGAATGALGPDRVDAGTRDETPSGVHGAGANVAEWLRDGQLPYASACWARAPLYDPSCADPEARLLAARGSSWLSDVPLPSAARLSLTRSWFSDVGIRCARLR